MLFLILSSILVLIVKRNKETFYLFGMYASLALMLTGILIYIAKKGGISPELQNFFFFDYEMKARIQYILITLDNLGILIAVGRYLFPLFLILLALHYTMIPWIRRGYYWINRLVFVLPILSLIIYQPDIFRVITNGHPLIQQAIVSGTFYWIIIYLIISIFLLLYEAYSINMRFIRNQFLLIVASILSLCLLYFLYCEQDPAQVYQFYSNDFVWKNGIYYMNSILSIPAYISIVLINGVFAIIGFSSILKYTSEIFEDSREEIILKRKFEAISSGTSTFVHSLKNQLLSNRVIIKRINRIYEEDTVNTEELKEYIDLLAKQNENAIARIEELYRSVKTNVVHLVPIRVKDILQQSLELYHHKYPYGTVEIDMKEDPIILADKTHLSEAIYNLLTNAQEANNENACENGKVILRCYNVRLYTVLEIKDFGMGMSRVEMKKIWEPYYSRKNTNNNWGMGLYYVRSIVKEHFGKIKIESAEGKGSTFYLLLPKFKE